MVKVLEVKNLKKKLGKREIIKDISFYVEEGVIFGFLGPNGSGKTTTIRMLVDLIAMDAGTVTIMGKDISKDREAALSHVGAVVENPELYKFLSGYENLKQIARIRGISDDRINEVIKLVGLEKRIKDKMKKYSLGMKQRLGLAAALLSKPNLLILDEPTNGLDPNGIKEFRTILQTLAREKNMSVFVSSHILAEVQNLCDVVAFIEDGQITDVETMAQLQSSHTYLLGTNKSEETLKTLQAINIIVVKGESETGYVIELEEEKYSEVMKELISKDIVIKSFDKHVKGLEERYLEIIKGGIN